MHFNFLSNNIFFFFFNFMRGIFILEMRNKSVKHEYDSRDCNLI